MRPSFLISLILLTSNFLFGQISLEHTYVGNGMVYSKIQPLMVNLELDGHKYVFIDRVNNQLDFYDINHAYWKTISYANATNNNNSGYDESMLYISQNLFDLDNEIEFMYVSISTGVSPVQYYTEVVNEDGTILFSEQGAPWVKLNIPMQQYPIYNTPNGTKLILSMTNGDANVYSLPGTLSSTIIPNGFKLSSNMGDPFPNPSSGKITIPYDLPEDSKNGEIVIYDVWGNQLKIYQVGKHFNSISLSTSELSPGNYFYQLKTDNGIVGTKKVIVVN